MRFLFVARSLRLIGGLVLLCLDLLSDHAYSVSGKIKYKPGFTHFDFVQKDAPFGGEIFVGELGDFDHINPYVSNSLRSGRLHPFGQGSLTMRSYDEPMTDYCYCAQSLTVAPDRKSVTFTIREGVEWDHGYGTLNAYDVLFSFETWRKKGSVFTRSLYSVVRSCEVLDSMTVRFTFYEPAPTLPNVVGGMPLLCKKFYAKNGIKSLGKKPMLALGPYRITNYKLGEYVCYQLRENFWGKDLPLHRGLCNYERITVRYYHDAEVMRMALLKGAVDSVIERDPVYIASKTLPGKSDDVRFYSYTYARPPLEHFIVLNTRKAYLKDRRVRQALFLLFRYDLLSRYSFQGVYKPITSVFQQTESQALGDASPQERALLKPFYDVLPSDVVRPFTHENHEDKEGYKKRVKAAVKLLEEAGWMLDNKTRRLCRKDNGQMFPPLHIYCNGTKEVSISEDLKKRLSAVGIILVVHHAEVPYLSHIMTSHTLYDFIFFRYPGTQYPGLGLWASFHSSMARTKGSRNYAGVCHPAVDMLLEHIKTSQDLSQQIIAARALDRVIMHEYFFIPLFFVSKNTFWARARIVFPPLCPGAGYILMNSHLKKDAQKDSCV